MAEAGVSKAKAGRPSHTVWNHFLRGEKRNRFHHHVFCRYCSQVQAHAQALGQPSSTLPSIESIRGVPTAMLRHLISCIHCPTNIRVEMKDLLANHKEKHRRGSNPQCSPMIDDLLMLEETGEKSSLESQPICQPNVVASTNQGPIWINSTLAKIALGGKVPYNWLWNDAMQEILPDMDLIDPKSIYEFIRSSTVEPSVDASTGTTLSVNSWFNVCTREFTVACSLIHQSNGLQPCNNYTISITTLPECHDDVTNHLVQIIKRLSDETKLIGIVCSSSFLLRCSRVAIEATALPITSILCFRSILRILSAQVFTKYRKIVEEVLFHAFGDMHGAHILPKSSWEIWIHTILKLNLMHPLHEACILLQEAYAALSGHLFTTFEVVKLLISLRNHIDMTACVDEIWSTMDFPWVIMSTALYLTSSHNPGQVKALQWISLSNYSKKLADSWMLSSTQFTNDLQAWKEGRFPFEPKVVDSYSNNVHAFYSFVSDSTPIFHEFCKRLYGFVPATVYLESYLPGLELAGLNPTQARIEIPTEVQLAVIRCRQSMKGNENERSSFSDANRSSVWCAEEWNVLCDEIELFITNEMAIVREIGRPSLVSLNEMQNCFFHHTLDDKLRKYASQL